MSGSSLATFLFLCLPTVTRPARREKGETELKKEEGKWGTPGAQREQLNPMLTTCHTDKALAGGEAEGSLDTHGPD